MAQVPRARPVSRWQRLRQTFRSPFTWLGLFGLLLFEASIIPGIFLTGVPPRSLFAWAIVRAALMSGGILIGFVIFVRLLWLGAPASPIVLVLFLLTCVCGWVAISMVALDSIQLLVFPAHIEWITTVQNVSFAATIVLCIVGMMAAAVGIARDMNQAE